MKHLAIFVAIVLLSLSAHIDARAKPDSEEFDWSEEDTDKDKPAPTATVKPAMPAAPSGAAAPTNISTTAVAASPTATNATLNGTHHHHHHHHNVSAPSQVPINPMSGGSLLSSNNVGYNMTCGISVKCDSSRNLVCSSSTDKCICDPAKNTIYIKSKGSCFEKSMKSGSFSCEYDEQCQGGPLGPYSKCDSGRCECLSTAGEKPVVRHNDKCFIQKRIGDYCENNDACMASINGITDCRPNSPDPTNGTIIPGPVPVNNTRCNCAWNYAFLNSTSGGEKDECALIATSESSSCKADIQCKAGLGELSRCFGSQCQCVDVLGKDVVVYYKGTCYKKLSLNDICTSDMQCQAGISDEAVCVQHESYLPNEKTCQCPQGKTCEIRSEDGAASVLVSLTLILMGAIATKVLA